MSSTFHVVARYQTKAGTTQEILSTLSEMAAASRTEPGNISYEFFRGVEDENQIVILEAYLGREDFDAHLRTSHFLELGAGTIIPKLESRKVTTYESPAGSP